MLRNINIKAVYNSEEDNILEDFYIPALSNSVSYDRAVGYFDAKMLTSAASGLAAFINNNGYMRLICGATLTEEEYIAIAEGYGQRAALEKLEAQFEEIVESNNSDLFLYQLNTLTWLIKHKKLDVKIALRRKGIHHQKTGIFRDANDGFIVFQGSANETNNALLPFNYETINVFKSWQPEFKEHYEPHLNSFKALWSNEARNTLVLDFSDVSLKVLSKKCPSVTRPKLENEIALWQKHIDTFSLPLQINPDPHIPEKIGGNDFKLRSHQKEALQNWKDNEFQGLFELATGAGKTITAIYGAVKMYESRKRLFVVISVPYQNLADQWAENLNIFGIRPIVCYGGEQRWIDMLNEKVLAFKSGVIKFSAVVVVDATLSSKTRSFYNLIRSLDDELKDHFLFIGDECHHHGAEAISNVLPRNANLRIGLSATPDRGKEDIGNDLIQDYYGEIISRYTLADALEDKVLTPYEYYLIPVPLTDEETEKYIDLSKKISKFIAIVRNSKNSGDQQDKLNILLNQRARLINGSANKPIALSELLSSMKPIKHSLFYCAEGKLDDGDMSDEEEGMKQIQLISSILHNYGWKSCQFTANENKLRRNQILEDFKGENIHSLVAMKCLDEGVDIPACSTAFILSSSRKPRQFIQRRGRILRKSPGKEKAVIYDFFATLPLENMEDIEIGRRLLIAELQRINEFASLSLNKAAAYKTLETYLKEFDLYHYVA